MKKPVIQFKDFTFQYHSQALPTLKNINLTIYQGEKVLIIGASGSGKSTLGSCLNGLIPFAFSGTSTGELLVNDIETKKSDIFSLSKHIGTVLQDSDGQFVGLTVAEDIAFALENDCVDTSLMKKEVHDAASLIDLAPLLTHSPFEVSGGQKQRTALAGVLVTQSPILLFDEPLANLDPATGKSAIELIDSLHSSEKTTIIIEHRLEDVLHCPVDRIILMHDGEIIKDSNPHDFLASDILRHYGIRDPLYLSACRKAGISITKDMNPASLESFDTSQMKPAFQAWMDAQEIQIPKLSTPLLEIKDLTFKYNENEPVLENISLTVNQGEMVALVGKNGAGKSTLSKCIVGFEKEDKGEIILDGINISSLSIKERADHIGIVLQNPNQMISKFLIFDEIALGLRIRKVPEDEIEEKVHRVMKICGLYPFRKWPINALSFGQKKRVTIASILVLNPKILILDEPTAGQDYHHYSEMMNFLQELNQLGQTIILITHDMHLMLEYAPRAIVLANHQKVADQPSYEVLCDEKITQLANLKRTSLFDFAQKLQLENPIQFVQYFIQSEKGEQHER